MTTMRDIMKKKIKPSTKAKSVVVQMEEKIDYFIDQTNKRLEQIDKKLEQLISFRLMLIGSAATISVIFSAITTVVMFLIERVR